jgi:flavin reductase (DIM6/NTAB) family NADH-FMN oxidoreductase RutF
VLAEIECALVQKVTAGDHDLFIGQVQHTRVRPGRPLLYYASRYAGLG